MDKISLVFPTRNRPKSIRRYCQSIIDTVPLERLKYIEICIYIDNDDVLSEAEIKSCIENFKLKIIIYKGERITMSAMWQVLYEECVSGDIVKLSADDFVFRTMDWDMIVRDVINQIPDRIVLVYGDDGIQHGNIATYSFVTKEWIEVSGFWLPKYFSSDYCDTWLNEVSAHIGRKVYINELMIEHMHFWIGKAEIDENTKERLERHKRDGVDEIYKIKKPERVNQERRLKEYIKEMKNSKECKKIK